VQTIIAHREVDAPRISDAVSDVPASLESCYQRMVAKSPEDRFQSIAQFRSALGAAKSTSIESRSSIVNFATQPIANPAKKRFLRPWIWATAGAVSCMLLLIGFIALRPSDPDTFHRNLAKWAIVNAGYVTITTENGEQEIIDAAEIPDGRVRVVGLDLDGDMGDFSLDPIFDAKELHTLTLNNMKRIPVQKIAQIQTLESLSLYACDVDDDDMKVIASMPQLDALVVTDCPVTDDGVVFVSGLTGLTHLDLSGTDVTDVGLRLIGNLNQLQTLDLTATLVKGSGLAHVSSSVSALYLTGCEINDDAALHLKSLHNLELLDVTDTLLTGNGIRDLAGLYTLNYLDVGGIEVSAETLEEFVNLPLLTYLGLGGQDINSDQVDAILRLQQVKDLDLSNTNLNDDDFLRLLSLENLVTLDIIQTPVSQVAINRFDRKRPAVTLYVDFEDF
jgi:hypothetical protein